MLDDWRNKEAALMAFGAILDGPDPNTLSGLVGGAMPYLVAALAHPKAEGEMLRLTTQLRLLFL